MRFLNDKFFRAAVVVFLLLMILPFIFSTPEPEGKDIADLPDDLAGKMPVYKVIDKIARFYGFKKQDNQQKSSKTEIKTSENLKRIISAKKELAKELKQEQILSNEDGKDTQNATSATNINTQNAENIAQGQNPPLNLDNFDYNYFTEEETNNISDTKDVYQGKQTQMSAKNKTVRTSRQSTQPDALNNSVTKNAVNNASADKKTNITTFANTDKNEDIYFFDNKKSLKGTLGQNYFSSSNIGTKKYQDIYQSFDTSIKDITNFQISQKEEKKSRNVYLKTYRIEYFNPNTGKKHYLVQQQAISKEDAQNAQEIRQMTAKSIENKQYDTNSFQCSNTQTCPISVIDRDTLSIIEENGIPPHTVMQGMENNETFTNIFKKAENIAKNNLPSAPRDFPFLEFIYRTQDNAILRAPKDTFNVIAVRTTLGNKVIVPNDAEQTIDFYNTKTRIYVVPEENIYREYLKRNIPVIYYPKLSPEHLDVVYSTAISAIETLNRNKEEDSSKEQDKNAKEIALFLKK